MNITSAYIEQMNGIDEQIVAEIDGLKVYIPLIGGNRHYREIMNQVEAGTLILGDTVNIEE
jgi:hypothetical protein